MTQELHRSDQAHATVEEAGGVRRSKSMGVGSGGVEPASTIAKKIAETGGSHGLSPSSALQHDEEALVPAIVGALELQIAAERSEHRLRHRRTRPPPWLPSFHTSQRVSWRRLRSWPAEHSIIGAG